MSALRTSTRAGWSGSDELAGRVVKDQEAAGPARRDPDSRWDSGVDSHFPLVVRRCNVGCGKKNEEFRSGVVGRTFKAVRMGELEENPLEVNGSIRPDGLERPSYEGVVQRPSYGAHRRRDPHKATG
jgi:hypothetical protein